MFCIAAILACNKAMPQVLNGRWLIVNKADGKPAAFIDFTGEPPTVKADLIAPDDLLARRFPLVFETKESEFIFSCHAGADTIKGALHRVNATKFEGTFGVSGKEKAVEMNRQ
jgi:hypothetical protein